MDSLYRSSTQNSLSNFNESSDKYDHAKGAENNDNENVDTDVCDESENNELSKSSPSENEITKENQDNNDNTKEEKDKEEKTVINDSPPDGEDKPKQLPNDSMDDKFLEGENEKETRDDANAKYKYGDYEGAIQIWLRGLRSINYVLSKKEELSSERLESFQKLHATYCSNIAQGFMKLSKFSECVKYSLMAQESDKKNVKIYFRLAKGYFMLGEYDKSIQVINEGIEIDNDAALVNLLTLVKKKKETFLKKEKHMMKYIFDNLKDKPVIHEEKRYNSIFRAVYSFVTLLLMFVYALFVRSSSLLASIFKKGKIKNG
ncbi:Uncharacterized protein PCOAH_00040300 [Plasmodium coatneyi]|uniref:peptidylprolyl isomerase n=1 Tax=Plasmodium coatneyi TaxID=208452 RepID=A0A1B1E482_9APIC|nr:Uncharacterized protein PCOAH_00040300 [Plasmodium coatneyi]ANQ09805.1 Uncharacterized protein PCOAH_00040300 [Plasmodium coatneyi]